MYLLLLRSIDPSSFPTPITYIQPYQSLSLLFFSIRPLPNVPTELSAAFSRPVLRIDLEPGHNSQPRDSLNRFGEAISLDSFQRNCSTHRIQSITRGMVY